MQKSRPEKDGLEVGRFANYFGAVTKPPIIEHDTDEPPRDRTGNWPYWAGIILIAALWAITAVTEPINWHFVGLGALTGGVFVAIVLDYTGNRVPKWMR